MANTIKVLFWLHRSKANKDGLVPIIVRLTFKNKRVERATGFYVNPDNWNVQKQRLKGSRPVYNDINLALEKMSSKVNACSRGEEGNIDVHLPTIIAGLFVTHTDEPTLLKLIEDYNKQLKERVGNDCAFSTYEKYVFTYNKVKAFIEHTKKIKDILLRDVNTKFIMDFDHFLRVRDKNQHNTAVKYCINLKRVLNVAVLQGIVKASPLNGYKTVYKDTPQVYLSEKEVEILEAVELVKDNQRLVRDLFIFQCNTGLAYTDMVNLSDSDISIDSNGQHWIVKARQKSGIISTIPLLPKGLAIIEKYRVSPKPINKLFPHYSIQKYNEYIAQIGVKAGLHKRLSSHVGRRTFGNVALSRGISINVISKILGHSSTLITQRIYAITTQNIISREIEKW